MWTFNGDSITIIPESSYGFVYRITNLTNNRQYIGKKLFYAMKQRQVNGKKKKYKAESDWLNYFGSNDELITDIKSLGRDMFKREILRFCKNKGECTYFEAKYQYEFDVLLKPEEFYNSWIMCKVHRKHLQIDRGVAQ